jgi:hypothetical protein
LYVNFVYFEVTLLGEGRAAPHTVLPHRSLKSMTPIIFLYIMAREGYNWAFNSTPMYSEK